MGHLERLGLVVHPTPPQFTRPDAGGGVVGDSVADVLGTDDV